MRQTCCPICHKPVEKNNRFFPFCSKRCQLCDLGHWFNEDYAVTGHNAQDTDLTSDDATHTDS